MKMFLTRLDSVQSGDHRDVTQTDLPEGKRPVDRSPGDPSRNPRNKIHRFSREDVVRHPLVQEIIDAYENLENQKKSRRSEKFRPLKRVLDSFRPDFFMFFTLRGSLKTACRKSKSETDFRFKASKETRMETSLRARTRSCGATDQTCSLRGSPWFS